MAKDIEVASEKLPANRPGRKGGWRWNAKKRAAVEAILDGMSDVAASKRVGVSARSIYTWRHTPEFQKEVQAKLMEYGNRTRLRRMTETGAFANKLAKIGAEALDKKNSDGEPTGLGIALPVLREYRELRNQERIDLGDDVKRVESRVMIGGHMETEHKVSITAMPFGKFFEANKDVIDVDPALPPEKQLIEASYQLMQRTDILDHIEAEDREDERKRVEEQEKK